MRRSALKRTSALRRRTALRPVSDKRAAIADERRALVTKLLLAHPVCEFCRQSDSQHVHERLTRARGGSILDESNCVCLCPTCHRYVHDHPDYAGRMGLLVHSWDA